MSWAQAYERLLEEERSRVAESERRQAEIVRVISEANQHYRDLTGQQPPKPAP